MASILDDFVRDFLKRNIHLFSPAARLRGLTVEERVAGLSAEEVAATLDAQGRKAALDYLNATVSSHSPTRADGPSDAPSR